MTRIVCMFTSDLFEPTLRPPILTPSAIPAAKRKGRPLARFTGCVSHGDHQLSPPRYWGDINLLGGYRFMNRLVKISSTIFICSSMSVLAEPSPTVYKLINKPVSLFSFGLIRAAEQIEDDFAKNAGYRSLVTYDWDRNRIDIKLYKDVEDASRENVIIECRTAIEALREWSYIREGKVWLGDNSRLSYFFTSYGYTNSDLEGATQEIDKIINLSLMVIYGGDRVGSCTAPLLGTGYSIDEK